MSILIDLIIVAIFVLMIIISARQGFVKALTRLIGFAVVIAVVAVAVNPLADLTYQKAIEPSIVNAAGDLVIEGGDRAADSVWESLPTFITDNADDFGISKDKISNVVSDDTKIDAKETLQKISQELIKPAVVTVLEIFYSVILIIVLLFFVRIIANFLNKLFSFKLVGKINRFLGGALGVVKGLIIALIFCNAISLIVKFVPNGLWIFNSENIANAYIFNLLTNVF